MYQISIKTAIAAIRRRITGYTLRSALLVFVLLPFVAVMGLGGWYSLHTLEQQVEARMQEDIELIARAIRLPVSNALERDAIHEAEEALASVSDIGRVYGVYVYDEDGRQIASSGTRRAQVGSNRAAELASRGDRQGEFEDIGSEEIFSYFLPLTEAGGRIAGLLQVTRRGSDFQTYIGQVRIRTLSILAITGLLLTMVVFYGHYRAVGRHLHGIEASLLRIGNGQTGERVPEQGPAEIHILARSINTMLDRLVRSQNEIEQRRAREMELKIRLQQSEKLAAIGRLAAGVAHELGTPLSTVDGKAQRALRKHELPQGLEESLEQIRIEVRRMEHIIHQLLDFGRRNPLQLRTAHCRTLLRSVSDQLDDEIHARGIRLQIRGEGLDTMITVDSVRMEQALSNLLRNALQAARTQVLLECDHDNNDCIVFTVEDDGPGIDTTLQSRLFDPFFTTKPVGEGTGLGLSVVYAAVEDHGGRIDVDRSSELGGARFRISINLAQLAEMETTYAKS